MSQVRWRGIVLSAQDEAMLAKARYAAPKQGEKRKPISDAMARNLEQALSFFNGTMERCWPESLANPLDQRVTLEAVKEFKRELAVTNSPRSVHDILTRFAILCRRLGFSAQAKIVAKEAGRAPGRQRKRAPKISAAAVYHQLVARFASLREEIASLGSGWRARARRRRAVDEAMTTLMMILLLTLPVRRRNLMGLALGKSLRQVRGTWVIVMPPEETKAGEAAIRVVPPQLAAHLDLYLVEIRPIRMNAASGEALWLSPKGKALPAITAHSRIRNLAKRVLGVTMSMHLFRQLVGHWAAGYAGLGIAAAQQAFQHADLTTTQRAYVEEDTAQAQQAMRPHYQALHDALGIGILPERLKSTDHCFSIGELPGTTDERTATGEA